ncbi:hypothetical protein L7F50_004032 [Salmonella enterica subsp. enterica serovar Telelkebir]|nr:hypothetical protein [Salmonella enterica subsp. enterica serovar Telelkebir]
MVVPFNGWLAGNVNGQRDSGVAGLDNMSPQEKIDRAMNEYAAAALSAAMQHAEHPFKNFLEQIFGVFERDFMMFTTRDGQMELLATALMENEQLRKDLGLKAFVVGEDNAQKAGMARFGDGTIALIIMIGGRHELICGSELGCGGESLWDSLQHKFEQGMPGAVGLATGIMKEAAQEFNKTGDMIMAGIQAAITFSAHDPDRFPPITFVSALNDMRSSYLDGPVGWSGNRDLSVLGNTPEFAELTAAVTGRLVERAERGIGLLSLAGFNMGLCGGTETNWFGLSMPGDARVVTGPWQESGTVIMQRRDNDIIDIFLCGGRSRDKHLQVTCTQSPISQLEVMRGDIDAYRRRIKLRTAKFPMSAAWSLGSWAQWKYTNNARLNEAKECFDKLGLWIRHGRDPEAEPDIPEQVSKDELQNEQSEWILYRVSLVVDAVRNAIDYEKGWQVRQNLKFAAGLAQFDSFRAVHDADWKDQQPQIPESGS